jgi:glycosyltransferase involved in cell wall biosynthesis
MKRALKAKQYNHKILPFLPKLDVMLIRGPSPLMPFTASLCKRYHIPYAYLLVGDYLKSLAGVNSMNILKRSLLWSFYYVNKKLQDYYAKEALIFANNKIIFEEYKKVYNKTYEIRTTTLSKNDFFQKEDTCIRFPIKLGYAGRIEPTKGLDDMLDAVVLVRQQGYNVELHIAGWDPTDGEKYLKKLIEKAEKNGLIDFFVFHGKKQVGEELLSFYRECDIFLIATKGNEGFPRTIWEAMAQSIPVISTKVGAIPNMLDNGQNVLLVEQSSPKELADAIILLIKDKNLRKELISNGYTLAQTNTIELQSKKMLNIMKRYIENAEN